MSAKMPKCTKLGTAYDAFMKAWAAKLLSLLAEVQYNYYGYMIEWVWCLLKSQNEVLLIHDCLAMDAKEL